MSFDEVKTAADALSTAERLNLLLMLGDSLRKPLGAGKKKRARKEPEEGAAPKPPSDWQTGLAAIRMVLKTRSISPKVPLVTQMGKALKENASWPNPSEADVMAVYETVSETRSVASNGGAAAAGASGAAGGAEPAKVETVEKVEEKKKERVEKMKKSKGDEAAAAGGGGGGAEPKKAAKKAAAEEIDYDNIEEAKPWTHGKTTYLRQFNYLWTNDGVWVGAWDGKKIDKTAKEPVAEME
jgi:hypothetical protein